MEYNFSEKISRLDTDSVKWDNIEKIYGRKDLLPMWVADMDFPSPPAVIEAIKKRAAHPIYGYSILPHDYHDSFMNWTEKRHNWQLNPEWLSNAQGVVAAMAMCVDLFTDRGDKVLIQTPVYRPFFTTVTKNKRKLVTSHLISNDGYYQMDYDDLRTQFSEGVKLMILCNPHNPVGRVWTEAELKRLGELCLEYDVKLVTDEIWGDLVYAPHRYRPLASVSKEIGMQTITLTAANKTFNIAGLNNAIAVIPNPELKDKFDEALSRAHLQSTNIFAMVAFTAAYRHGEEWLDQLIQVLKSNRDLVFDQLNNYHGLQVTKPEGTYLVWLDFRAIEPKQDEIMAALVKQGVALNGGSSFGRDGFGFMRMNIGCPPDMVAAGIEKIQAAIIELRKERTT